MWRLLAIDNGLLSFSDQRHGQDWPVVLVTNPKDAAMAAPGAEVTPLFLIILVSSFIFIPFPFLVSFLLFLKQVRS